MQLQHLIRRNSIRGIVGLEAVFIRFFNTVPRYNRHRVPCGGSVCSRDADGFSGQGFFDGDGTVRRQVHIVRVVIACAALRIALPVAGNVNIAADNHGTSVNVNTAAAACGMVPGDAAAVHGEIRSFAAHMHSTAIFIGIVPGDVTAVHGEERFASHIHSAAIPAK